MGFFQSKALWHLPLSGQDDKGVLTPLSIPKKLLKKFYQNLAAQTRYGAIKSAPLIEECKQHPLSLVSTAAKAAGLNETAFYLANLSANVVR